jgi:hypothetical protein
MFKMLPRTAQHSVQSVPGLLTQMQTGKEMKVMPYSNLVPKLRLVALYLHSTIHLHGFVLSSLKAGINLTFKNIFDLFFNGKHY